MKWTTFILIFLLECSFAQHSVAFLKAPTTSSAVPVNRAFDAITSPLAIVRGMPYVDAHLNGQSGKFLLDTGAPMLVLNEQAENDQKVIPAASFSTNFNLSSTKVSNFAWANVQRKNMDALVLDISHLENASNYNIIGIIGYDILKDFEVFINYVNNQVLLLPSGNNKLHKAAKPLATLDIEMQSHLPVIAVQIGDQVLHFGLDTGAGINLIDDDCKSSLPAHIFTSLGIEEIRSIDQRSNQVEGTSITKVSVAQVSLNDMKYLFTDLTDLEVQSDIKIDGLLGFPFFERVKCSIDYPNKKLHIWSVNP